MMKEKTVKKIATGKKFIILYLHERQTEARISQF